VKAGSRAGDDIQSGQLLEVRFYYCNGGVIGGVSIRRMRRVGWPDCGTVNATGYTLRTKTMWWHHQKNQ
jgi:hypothetical protein